MRIQESISGIRPDLNADICRTIEKSVLGTEQTTTQRTARPNIKAMTEKRIGKKLINGRYV